VLSISGLLPKPISCFDKLSMSGKLKCFQHITVRPEPVEGQTIGLGNSPLASVTEIYKSKVRLID